MIVICENFSYSVVFSHVTGWRTNIAIIGFVDSHGSKGGKSSRVFLLIPQKHLHDCCCSHELPGQLQLAPILEPPT